MLVVIRFLLLRLLLDGRPGGLRLLLLDGLYVYEVHFGRFVPLSQVLGGVVRLASALLGT